MFKKIIFCLTFFIASTISCSEKKTKTENTECDQIKNVLTDCLEIHRGAFNYIKDCGDLSLDEISNLNSCQEVFDYVENK